MRKLTLLTFLIAGLAVLALQSCNGGTGMYVEVEQEIPALGAAAGTVDVLCEDCTVFSADVVKGADAADQTHGGSCPQTSDAPKGVFEGLLAVSFGCTDADGLTSVVVPCLDLDPDCKANDESFLLVAFNDDPGGGDDFEVFCCEVLDYILNDPFPAYIPFDA